jgi:hypothetical protein
MIDTVVCPSCRRALRVPDTLRGQLVKCPACELTFTATEDLEPAPRRVGEGAAVEQQPQPVPLPPSPRPRLRDDDDYDDRRRPRRRRRDDDDDYDDRRRRPYVAPPGKAQAIAIMTLVGGIFATIFGIVLMMTCFGLFWPGTYYTMVAGIMCIVKGSQLLSPNSRYEGPPTATAVMQIVNIVNLDVINVTLGILNLVFLSDPEVRGYYRG